MVALSSQISELKEQRREEYDALEQKLLAGDAVDAVEVEAICLRAGQDPGDLARRVERRLRRVAERERLSLLSEKERAVSVVDAEIVANNERLAAAQQAYAQEAWRLNAARDAAIAEVQDVRGIRERLINECGDRSFSDRIRTLELYIDSYENKRRDAHRQLLTQRAFLRDASNRQADSWWWDDYRHPSPVFPASVPDSEPFAAAKNRVCRANAELQRILDAVGEHRLEIVELQRQQFEW